MSAGPARTVLATVNAALAVEALRELHRVCLAMDLERQDERPTEDEYQLAMACAAEALQAFPLTEAVA